MKNVYIDFESRSTVDIWAAGGWVYSIHPSTQVLCAAYAIDNGPVNVLVDSFGELVPLAEDPNVVFVAHNAFFERCIWFNQMVAKHKLPTIPINRWKCTAAKAATFGLPKSLEKCAEALRLSVTKDMGGRAIMLKLCKPRAPKKSEDKSKIYWHEDPADYQKLYDYCATDVAVERLIDQALPELNPMEKKIWELDQKINSSGVKIDRELVIKSVKILAQHTDSLNTELSHITEGAITKGTEVASMTAYLQREGVKLDSLTKNSVKTAIQSGSLSPKHLRILSLRQEIGKSSTAKYHRLIEATDLNGILRDCYVYHGASTGRWAGKLVQLQNLPRIDSSINTDEAIEFIRKYNYETLRFIYQDKLNNVLSSCIRNVFIAREGTDMHIMDYSAIEARVVFWLSDCKTGLEDFRANDSGTDVDIYVKMARRIYNDKIITKEDKGKRQLGKQAILGCGYGMGHAKFKDTCAGYGIEVTEQAAQRSVQLYRETYHEVKTFWYAMQEAAISAFNSPGTSIQCGKLTWFYSRAKDYLLCRLPSGRFLAYSAPRLEPGPYGPELTYMTEVNGQWIRNKTYGGHLVENATQAVARDLMAWAMVSLDNLGYQIVMHTHDEIVAESLAGRGAAYDVMEKVMCEPPTWGIGIPIKVEGLTTKRYKKG